MKKIEFTAEEKKKLKNVKSELLRDSHATFNSQARNYKILEEIANKYGVDSQTIYNQIPE